MLDVIEEPQPQTVPIPSPAQKRMCRPSGWDVRPEHPRPAPVSGEAPNPPTSKEPAASSSIPQELENLVPAYLREFAGDAPIMEDNVLVMERHAVSDPVTIPSQPGSPQGWSSEAGITSSRSGNHYSNGESRLTPEFEWNGWESVSREKHPRRILPRPQLQLAPSPGTESEYDTTSPLVAHMEIDSDASNNSQDSASSFPEGYIPLEIPGITERHDMENVDVVETPLHPRESHPISSGTLPKSPDPNLGPTVADADTITQGLSHTKPPAHQQEPSCVLQSGSGTMASSNSIQATQPEAPQRLDPDQPVDEEDFEDATPQLPEPSSPPPHPGVAIESRRPALGELDGNTSLCLRSESSSPALALGIGSIKSLRAAARLRVSSNTSAAPTPSPTPTRSAYDLWGFRRAALTTSSDGDAIVSPIRKL